MLSVILKSKLIWSALGGSLLVVVIGLWYKGNISEAEQRGYDQKSLETDRAILAKVLEMRAYNAKLEERDSELVARLRDLENRPPKIITKIVEVANEIDDTTCRELPVDFVRLFNAASDPNCTGGGNSEDCPIPEIAAKWTPEQVAPAADDDAVGN